MSLMVRMVLTYLLHSTILLGLAALASIVLRGRRLALQEALLRAALVGGLVTSALQLGLGFEPLAGRLSVRIGAGPVALASPRPSSRETALRPSRELPRSRQMDDVEDAVSVPTLPAPVPSLRDRAFTSAAGLVRNGPLALGLVWAGAALLGLARLLVAGSRLRRLLHGRFRIAGSGLRARVSLLAAALGIRRSVGLSAAPRLMVPLATGLVRPEVCLPARALAEMDAEEQLALCAHELAHLARRDPAWILVARTIEAIAPVQPLNTWARRRLQDLAECLSDDLAVSASARPLGLARSLVDVASWTIGETSFLPVTVAGALDRRSRLGHRVERLMDPVREPERPNRSFLPVAALCVLASALVTPVVSAKPPAPVEPEAPVAEAAPAPPQPADASPAEAPLPEPAPLAPLPELAPLPPLAPPSDPPPPAPPELPPLPAVAPLPGEAPAPPAPGVRPAPRPRPAPSSGAETRLEELERQIEARAKRHEAEFEKLQEQMAALADSFAPNEAEIERLGDEMGRAADELAQAVVDGVAGEKGERATAAARRMAELEGKLRALTGELRLPKDEIRSLAEKSRALALQARPTEDELRELRRLSRDLAREATPSAEELAQVRREAREQAHAASRQAREAAGQAREAMRRAEQDLRRARAQMRHAREEARRAEEEARRQSERKAHRQGEGKTPVAPAPESH